MMNTFWLHVTCGVKKDLLFIEALLDLSSFYIIPL